MRSLQLCGPAQVAAFAQTKLGQQACQNMRPEREQPACQALLQETRAVNALEEEYAADTDFGGIQTAEVGAGCRGCLSDLGPDRCHG